VEGIGTTVAEDLSQRFEEYAKDPENQARSDHLGVLCQSAEVIKRKTRRHPSIWSFGPWNAAVQFPSVMTDGIVVMDAQLQ
jgi:hypothetical protein